MKAPQIILICILGVSILANLVSHGKPRQGKYDFWASVVEKGVLVLILLWGGFFN